MNSRNDGYQEEYDTMKWHKHYPAGIPASFEYPLLSQKHYFNESAAKHPERVFMVYRGNEISFAEANSLARRLANALLEAGCNRQDRVALIVGSTPEFVLSVQACFKIGAIVAPINPRYTPRELERFLRDCQVETVILLESCLEKMAEIFAEQKTDVKRIIVVQEQGQGQGQSQSQGQGQSQSQSQSQGQGQGQKKELDFSSATQALDLYYYDEMLARSKDTEPEVAVFSGDCAALLHTGGTTGVSKACMISHANLEASTYGWASWYTYPFAPDEHPVILCPVPMYHIYGLVGNVGLASLNAGCILLIESLNLDDVLPMLAKYEPNMLCVVPSIIIALVHHPGLAHVDARSIKVVGVGGDSIPESARQAFESITGLKITVGYGLTETSGSICGHPYGVKPKEGSIGLPLPDVKARVVSLKDPLKEVAPGELGELAIKGPQVIASYWNQAEETEKAIKDGWLLTGDIACMDDEGWIFIKERKKDLIITNGFNVYPKEVDGVLHAHPHIKEACTIGVPDPKRGEMVKSYIVVAPGERLSAEEVVAYCREYLAGYKVPKSIEFIEVLPKTAVGKASRIALRQRALCQTKSL